MDTPGNLVDSPIWGVVFQIRISPRIRNQNRNGSKCSVRDISQSDLCKNLGKFGSLPCPLKSSSICELIAGEHEWWTLPSCQTARPLSMRSPVMSLLPPRDFRWGSCVVGRMSVICYMYLLWDHRPWPLLTIIHLIQDLNSVQSVSKKIFLADIGFQIRNFLNSKYLEDWAFVYKLN